MRFAEININERVDVVGNKMDADNNIGSGLQAGPPFPPADSNAVKAMQARLGELGYSVGSTGIDGKYGPRTSAAVAAFKKDNGINTSGGVMSAEELQKLNTATKVANPTPTGASTGNAGMRPLSQDSVTQGKVGAVLDLIAGPESGGRYDAVYPGRTRPQILDMTIDQLIQDMRSRVRSQVAAGARQGSSASGRYQYIRSTLEDVVRSMGINTATTKFTPAVQDQIAIHHLQRNHGLNNWLEGRMSNEDFLNRIAGTWAGVPKTSGQSAYAGDAIGNAAGISARTALNTLDGIRNTA
jgi:peptidoglycan hydrolase-like protein with peptidoglycan-binding domain